MTSLRLRVALALALVGALATLVVGVVGQRTTSRQLYAEVDRSLDQAAVVVVRADRVTGRPVVERIIVPERSGLDPFLVQVIGPAGRILRSNAPTALPVDAADVAVAQSARAVRYRTVEIDDSRFRVRTASLGEGAVQVGRSLDETDDVLDGLRTEMWWWMIAIALSAAGLGWILADRISAPLRRLGAVADRVATTARVDEADAEALGVPPPAHTRDEVQRLRGALARMFTALGRARDDQERLVQDAGHELRTPLTSLRTNVDVLGRYPDMDPATRASVLDDITRDVEELTVLVNEVVEVASGGTTDDTAGPIVLGRAVAAVVTRFERRQGRVVDLDVDDTVVVISTAALERAVANLLDNAHKFDGGTGPVELRIRSGCLEVLDRGPGVPEDELAAVFDRFHRSLGARTLPGSGLGLAIVADIVSRAGGRVHARNRGGGGAAIGFTLPVAGRDAPVAS